MASEMQRSARVRQRAFEDTHAPGRRTVTGRQAAAAAAGAPGRVTRAGSRLGRQYSARGMLTAELLAGAGIVAIRAVEDYEPQADGTLKGKIGHPAGQYGPLPILAGLLTWFFLLSFLAARGGSRAKVAVIAGGLTDLVLAMNSMPHMQRVAATFSGFGTATLPPGDWQTSGTQAGSPLTGSSGGSGTATTTVTGGTGTSPVTADQQALAKNALAKTPNPGIPYVRAQVKTAGQLGSSIWHWIDRHFFGGKPFWNGL